ncbi:MAG TPA: ChaN family lipoprotein [Phycisphaerae bacterium]|nr:ChaN family lipoprotein [Phycisphaerae bacterium]HRW55689.1 ChaN family lipoprotein [Phycisphaerae bacterium]
MNETLHQRRALYTSRFLVAIAIASSPLVPGCQKTEHITIDPRLDSGARTSLRESLPIFNASGSRVSWEDMIRAAERQDVIIIGEQHDDAVGHATELAFVEDATARWPDTALSLEMLDRRRQATADDYVAGIIDRDTFIQEVATTNFRAIARSYLAGDIDRATFEDRAFSMGWPDWMNNYQPIIDVAQGARTRVIAANTPWRRYQSIANKEGFERLSELTPAQRALVETPAFLPEDGYRDRFFGVMTGGSSADAKDSPHNPKNTDNEPLMGAYRAQCVMDATMADSIADALENGDGRVIHLVGQFHSDFQGGLVQQLRRLRPGVRVMTLSLQRGMSETLREEDRNRADYVVYTAVCPAMK